MRQVANNITLKRHITGVDTTLCNAVFAAAASHFVDPVDSLANAETIAGVFPRFQCTLQTKRLPRRRLVLDARGGTEGIPPYQTQ